MTNIPCLELSVRYTGLFDFDGLYAAIIDWAKNYGYIWHEKVYKHKVPSPAGAEQEFIWVMEKNVTEYVKYTIIIVVHIWDLTEVVVDIGGKKKALSNARSKMDIKGVVDTDWQKKFDSSSLFIRKLGEFYEKIVLKKEIESVHWDTVNYRMLNLQNLMKQYFDMQTKKYEYKGYLGEG